MVEGVEGVPYPLLGFGGTKKLGGFYPAAGNLRAFSGG